jgi:hypothetical protein
MEAQDLAHQPGTREHGRHMGAALAVATSMPSPPAQGLLPGEEPTLAAVPQPGQAAALQPATARLTMLPHPAQLTRHLLQAHMPPQLPAFQHQRQEPGLTVRRHLAPTMLPHQVARQEDRTMRQLRQTSMAEAARMMHRRQRWAPLHRELVRTTATTAVRAMKKVRPVLDRVEILLLKGG